MGVHEKNLKYNLTEIDYEFHYFIKNVRLYILLFKLYPLIFRVLQMSCRAVMRLPYSYRCQMAKQVGDCKRIINLFNYFRMMYCSIHIDNKTTEVLFMFLFSFICVAFLWLMSFNIGA